MLDASEHVHFIGIGGYGMSAIARVMLDMGFRVSGSDMRKQDLTEKLAARGAQVFIGHHSEHVRGADVVVYSTACPEDNVERVAASELNIPVLHRSQMLARLMSAKQGIAVAGAHGKTSTTSMIALVMETCGLDPTFIIGGEMLNVGSNAQAGNGDYVVAEADESDGSFLQYHPAIALVMNIEADHLEHYDGEFQNLKDAYAQFLSQVKTGGKSIVCIDDETLRGMLPSLNSDYITFAIDTDADYRAINLQLGDRKARFDVLHEGKNLGTMEISIPGKHNVYNALATLITCLKAGLEFQQIADAIRQFRGAKRRFQVLEEINDILVIDDYAHHPTEIQATITAAKATGKHITAVFQPQRYSRTYFLFDAFSRSFSEADEVIITDIYSPVGEERIAGINSEKLVELIRENSHSNAHYIGSKEDAQQYLLNHVKPGGLVLTMGAGDIWRVAHGLVNELKQQKI